MKRRALIQVAFLAISLGIMATIVMMGKSSIHNFCPYALVCFGLMKGNLWVLSLGIAALGIFLGLLFIILSMFWGRFFCGYICPLGTLQEYVNRLRGKKRSRQIPIFAERKLAKIKYWILGITALLVIGGLAWMFMAFCPIYAVSMLPRLAWLGLFTAIIIVIGGYFLERMWCRFLCPYAALLNIAQFMGKLFAFPRAKIRRNLERCIDCGVCSLNCPMNLDILCEEYVESPDCIHCHRCAEKCPKPGTISQERDK